MSNSGLIKKAIMSPNKNPRTMKICGVAIHCMAGNLTIDACGELFSKQGTKASSNYGIDSQGNIALYVNESDRSWCTSSQEVDQRAVTIEVANTKTGDPWPISDAAYNSLINLLVDICVRNDIKSLKWSANKSYGTSFNVSKQNIWVHRWFANKSCPGDYIYNRLGTIAGAVNNRLKVLTDEDKADIKKKARSNEKYDASAVGGSSKGSTSAASSTDEDTYVTYNVVKKYIATVDHNTTLTDFSNFMKNDVAGVVIEAGFLFDSLHNKMTNFQNSKLDAQVKSCAQANLPYGFYFIGRGRSTAEIREEIYELSFVLRKYPTQLGLWMVPDLTGSKANVDLLLDDYHKRLLDLGLANQMGLYCTEKQLKKCNWSKHQDEWFLWIVDRFKKKSQFDDDINPEMFDVEVE